MMAQSGAETQWFSRAPGSFVPERRTAVVVQTFAGGKWFHPDFAPDVPSRWTALYPPMALKYKRIARKITAIVRGINASAFNVLRSPAIPDAWTAFSSGVNLSSAALASASVLPAAARKSEIF